MSSSLSEKLLKVCDYINANRVHQNISPDDGKLRIRSALIEPPGWMHHGLRQYPDAIMPGAAAGCNDES